MYTFLRSRNLNTRYIQGSYVDVFEFEELEYEVFTVVIYCPPKEFKASFCPFRAKLSYKSFKIIKKIDKFVTKLNKSIHIF